MRDTVVYLGVCMALVAMLAVIADAIDVGFSESAPLVADPKYRWGDYAFWVVTFALGELEVFLVGLLVRVCILLNARRKRGGAASR